MSSAFGTTEQKTMQSHGKQQGKDGKLPLPDDYFGQARLTRKERKYMTNLGKQSCKEVVYYSRRSGGPVNWVLLSSFDGIEVFQGMDHANADNKNMTYLRGACRVHATLDEVADFFRQDTAEKQRGYSQTVGKDILDQKTLINLIEPTRDNPHHRIAAKWCAIESPSKLARNRDFCFLECHDEFVDTSTRKRGWVRSMHSVKLPFCPPLDKSYGVVRGAFYRSGFLFLESSEPGYVDAIHTLHLDLKGRVPDWIKTLVMKKRIKNIAGVNKYFEMKRLGRQKLLGDLDLPSKEGIKYCQCCDTKFTVLKRKFRCRKCGRVVCNSCAKKYTVDTRQHGPKKIRVCRGCSGEIMQHSEPQSRIGEDEEQPGEEADERDYCTEINPLRKDGKDRFPAMNHLSKRFGRGPSSRSDASSSDASFSPKWEQYNFQANDFKSNIQPPEDELAQLEARRMQEEFDNHLRAQRSNHSSDPTVYMDNDYDHDGSAKYYESSFEQRMRGDDSSESYEELPTRSRTGSRASGRRISFGSEDDRGSRSGLMLETNDPIVMYRESQLESDLDPSTLMHFQSMQGIQLSLADERPSEGVSIEDLSTDRHTLSDELEFQPEPTTEWKEPRQQEQKPARQMNHPDRRVDTYGSVSSHQQMERRGRATEIGYRQTSHFPREDDRRAYTELDNDRRDMGAAQHREASSKRESRPHASREMPSYVQTARFPSHKQRVPPQEPSRSAHQYPSRPSTRSQSPHERRYTPSNVRKYTQENTRGRATPESPQRHYAPPSSSHDEYEREEPPRERESVFDRSKKPRSVPSDSDDMARKMAMSAMKLYEEKHGRDEDVDEDMREQALQKMMALYASEMSGAASRKTSKSSKQSDRKRRNDSDERSRSSHRDDRSYSGRSNRNQTTRDGQHEYRNLSDLSSTAFEELQRNSTEWNEDEYVSEPEEDRVPALNRRRSSSCNEESLRSPVRSSKPLPRVSSMFVNGAHQSSNEFNLRSNAMTEARQEKLVGRDDDNSSDSFSELDLIDLPHLMRKEDSRQNSFNDERLSGDSGYDGRWQPSASGRSQSQMDRGRSRDNSDGQDDLIFEQDTYERSMEDDRYMRKGDDSDDDHAFDVVEVSTIGSSFGDGGLFSSNAELTLEELARRQTSVSQYLADLGSDRGSTRSSQSVNSINIPRQSSQFEPEDEPNRHSAVFDEKNASGNGNEMFL